MKRIIKAYISFTRTEKMGVVFLAVIIIILVMVRATMHLWVRPERDAEKEKKLSVAWENFKHAQTLVPAVPYNKKADTPYHNTGVYAVKEEHAKEGYTAKETAHPHLFPFDPNTLDSAGFIRLGMNPHTTAILLHWRAKGKIFRKKEELQGVYTLKPEEYKRLEPFIVIK